MYFHVCDNVHDFRVFPVHSDDKSTQIHMEQMVGEGACVGPTVPSRPLAFVTITESESLTMVNETSSVNHYKLLLPARTMTADERFTSLPLFIFFPLSFFL